MPKRLLPRPVKIRRTMPYQGRPCEPLPDRKISMHFSGPATDGIKALELVQENRPDLVLLDIGLPHMSGFEVLENIRKQYDMPVIVLTALDTEDDKVKFPYDVEPVKLEALRILDDLIGLSYTSRTAQTAPH